MQTASIPRRKPALDSQFPFFSLIEEPTPVDALVRLGKTLGHSSLFVKREDQTHSLYGGNKVRNLEFIFGDALQRGAKEVITVAPFGSNFSAALAAQAQRAGLKVKFSNFITQRNAQIDQHYRFTEAQGVSSRNFDGMVLGSSRAIVDAFTQVGMGQVRGQKPYFILPGGSSVLGAMGHANALLEAHDQFEMSGQSFPDFIIVGAGTCGTHAGLLAGVRLLGLRTRVIGIRCAEPIVCNRYRVASLASKVLGALGARTNITAREVDLVDLPANRYAVPSPFSFEAMEIFNENEKLLLDTTYTSKVGNYLIKNLAEQYRGRKVLYWHTFSPAAMTGTYIKEKLTA